MNTAKIRELAEQIEKAVPSKEKFHASVIQAAPFSLTVSEVDRIYNALANSYLHTIAQAAGGIKELCNQEIEP